MHSMNYTSCRQKHFFLQKKAHFHALLNQIVPFFVSKKTLPPFPPKLGIGKVNFLPK